MSYCLILYDGKYPDEPGSMKTMIGSYPTREAANFIAGKVKERQKLTFFPKIVEIDCEPSSTFVEDYLKKTQNL